MSDLFKNGSSAARLRTINYVGFVTPVVSSIAVTTTDEISISPVVDGKSVVSLTRKVSTQPALFDVMVIYDVDVVLSKSATNMTHEKYVNEVGKDVNKYFSTVFALMSTIISNITAISGGFPIVTPPAFQTKPQRDLN